MMEDALNNAQPGFVYTVIIASALFLVFGSYKYIFEKPLTEYLRLRSIRKTLLQEVINNKIDGSGSIEQLKEEIGQLTNCFYGETPIQDSREMVAQEIVRLDNISSKHGVQFLSVTPGNLKTISMFKVVSFDVNVTGQYFQLYEWLHEVERSVSSMIVEQFEVRPKSGSKDLHMKIKMVSYKPFLEEK